jgi:hypothetical protein
MDLDDFSCIFLDTILEPNILTKKLKYRILGRDSNFKTTNVMMPALSKMDHA